MKIDAKFLNETQIESKNISKRNKQSYLAIWFHSGGDIFQVIILFQETTFVYIFILKHLHKVSQRKSHKGTSITQKWQSLKIKAKVYLRNVILKVKILEIWQAPIDDMWYIPSTTGIGLHLIDAKGIPWDYPRNPGCYQVYWLLSSQWWQDLIAKYDTYRTHWTWRNWTGTYIEPSPIYRSDTGTRRYSASIKG